VVPHAFWPSHHQRFHVSDLQYRFAEQHARCSSNFSLASEGRNGTAPAFKTFQFYQYKFDAFGLWRWL
jgi:hypothetical protein